MAMVASTANQPYVIIGEVMNSRRLSNGFVPGFKVDSYGWIAQFEGCWIPNTLGPNQLPIS